MTADYPRMWWSIAALIGAAMVLGALCVACMERNQRVRDARGAEWDWAYTRDEWRYGILAAVTGTPAASSLVAAVAVLIRGPFY
jgi:hypothetical protein